MRRLALLSALVVLELTACKHKGQPAASRADVSEPAVPAVSVLKMSDPEADHQLLKGFWGLESGSWRWTSSKFAINLRAPEGSAQNGAMLEFKFSLPELVVNKTGPLTLSATINGIALPSQTYSKPGNFVYSAAIPADALRTGQGSIEFSTDKAMPPSNGDKRELALIAVSVALLPGGLSPGLPSEPRQ
jgi:hypothetical protein